MTGSSDDRARIQQRRARFVTVALAAAAGASACENEPTVCLSVAIDTGTDASDAGLDAPEDADSGDS